MIAIPLYRMFQISDSTVDTTTYTDWVTSSGVTTHQVTRLVTPAVRVRTGWTRLAALNGSPLWLTVADLHMYQVNLLLFFGGSL